MADAIGRLASGLDITSLVDQLVAVERAPTQARIDRSAARSQLRLSGYAQLSTAVSDFRGSFDALISESTYTSKTGLSSASDVVSVSATTQAAEASYTVDVQSLATSHAIAFDGVSDSKAVVGEGILTLQTGLYSNGESVFTSDASQAPTSITIDSANNTLEGIRDAINNSEAGISAAIIFDGSAYRLTLNSGESGARGAIAVSVTDDDGNNTDIGGLSSLNFNAGTKYGQTTKVAQDASLTINGIAVNSSSNDIDNAIDGVNLNLRKTGSADVNIVGGSERVVSAVVEFLDGYNALSDRLDELSAVNVATGETSALNGEGSIRVLRDGLRSILGSATTDGLTMMDLGVTTSRNGKLEFDESRLVDALENNPDAVRELFSPYAKSSDSDIEYFSSSSLTKPGVYDVSLTALDFGAVATSGSYTGAEATSFVVDASNSTLQVSIDGVASAALSIAESSYADGDALAAAIQAAIDGDLNLSSASVSAEVSYVGGALRIRSSSQGSASSVNIDSVGLSTQATLGLSVGAGVIGNDALESSLEGTIGGVSAQGEGSILSASGAAVGLQLRVLGGSTGDRGTVTYSSGLGLEMQNFLDSLTSSDGLIGAREDGLNKTLADLEDERSALNLRMENVEARLNRQFTALDILINEFQGTGDFLSQQLAALPGYGSSGG